MSAVEYRDWQKVEDSQLNAEERQHAHDAGDIGLCGLAGDLNDGDGPANVTR